MKRTHALLVCVALALGATTAAALPAPRGSASAAPSAAPKGSAAPAPSGSALPPGHPPVGDGLPPGHPPMDDDDEEAPADPHGGHPGQPQGERLPQDTVAEDPALPAGTIVVTVKDADEKPLPHAPVTLGVLHSTVAKGDVNEQKVEAADESGSARFDGLAFGGGHSFRVSTKRGEATFAHSPFGLSAKAGKRVVIHSYEASAQLDNGLLVVMSGIVGISLREDSIQIQQLISVANMGRIAWLADMPVELPRGFKAFNKQDVVDDARIEEVPGTGAALRGTFPPGQRDLEFHYQVPLNGETSQVLHIRLPQRVRQSRVIAEASRAMTLDVSGFPPAKHVEGRDGKRLLLTDLVARTQGEASTLDITLAGLPTQGPGRWIAVTLAVLAFFGGLTYFAQSQGGNLDEDARRDLAEAREALLAELVALERAHRSDEIGPRAYARVRTSLLDALARIVAMIEAAEPKKKPGQRRGGPKAPRRAEA